MPSTSSHRAASLLLVALIAACGDDFAVDARALDVPFVDQYDPRGAGPGYDGTMYCGPALLAGVAKARGQTGGMNDAELVELMAWVAGTDDTGTTGHGMVAALQWLGMQTDASAGGDLYWVDDELAAGHLVIANGDFYSLPDRYDPTQASGHYIAVTGVGEDWSVYEVTDPAARSCTTLTDDELWTFIESHPDGGFTISAW